MTAPLATTLLKDLKQENIRELQELKPKKLERTFSKAEEEKREARHKYVEELKEPVVQHQQRYSALAGFSSYEAADYEGGGDSSFTPKPQMKAVQSELVIGSAPIP